MSKKNNGGKEQRKISLEELKKILENHQLWLETNKKKGKKGDLSYLNLSGFALSNLDLSYINIIGTDLSFSELRFCNFNFANIRDSDLSNANLTGARFFRANLSYNNFKDSKLEYVAFIGCNIDNISFENVNFSSTVTKESNFNDCMLTIKQISQIRNFLNSNRENIEDEASFEIEELKNELEEQKKQLAAAQEGEKERIESATKFTKEKLEETKAILAKERAAKESTKEDIENGITHLQAPNSYLQSQINIQYWLTRVYGFLTILTIGFLAYYIGCHYSEFKAGLTEKTTFLQWLFYGLPIGICFSLIITFINQINSRLKNVINLHEKRRYVDSISGGLKAVQELSENNKEARTRISGVLDEILNNTIKLSEKLQEDVLLDEKPIDNKVSVSLKELKDLLSK